MNVNDLSILRLSLNEIKHQTKQASSNFKRTNIDKYNRQCQINSGINRLRIIWRNIASIEKLLDKEKMAVDL